jgi:predicted RNA-binding protein (virulence factor B family)
MFGPLGASVDVIAHSHNDEDIIPEDQPPLARGLILQKEIAYFRSQRNNVDVLKGEILPAYVESLRGEFNEDGVEKINVCLRSWGGKAKASAVSQQILAKLKASPNGVIPFGDRSSASYIQTEFPGISKVVFKKGLASLYKQGIAKPGDFETRLMERKTNTTSSNK